MRLRPVPKWFSDRKKEIRGVLSENTDALGEALLAREIAWPSAERVIKSLGPWKGFSYQIKIQEYTSWWSLGGKAAGTFSKLSKQNQYAKEYPIERQIVYFLGHKYFMGIRIRLALCKRGSKPWLSAMGKLASIISHEWAHAILVFGNEELATKIGDACSEVVICKM